MLRHAANTLIRFKPSILKFTYPIRPKILHQLPRFHFTAPDNCNSFPQIHIQNLIVPNHKNLVAIPLQDYKIDQDELTEKEKQIEPIQYCLFSSTQPIFPYNPMQCQIKLGHLKNITNQLVYCMQAPDTGLMYTVGIVLDKSVENQLNKELKRNEAFSSDDLDLIHSNINRPYNIDIKSRETNFRVKIIEIQVTPDGIFAKAIPFKDRSLTQEEKQFNVKRELNLVSQLVQSIKKSATYDRIEVFEEIDWSIFDIDSNIKQTQVNKIVYKTAIGISKMQSNYLKEPASEFIQKILESDTYIQRLLLLRKQLEAISGVMDIVQKNFKQADNQMVKMHQLSMAKLATEYIKQTYFKDAKNPYANFDQNQQNQGFAGNFQGGRNQQTSQIKKYLDKLNLIPDQPSRDKVRKEIDRFAQIDKHSSEFHKINTYLDEVFSIPWNKYTPVEWDIEYAKKTLDEEIQGLDKVKERIIQMIAVNKLKNSDNKSKGFILLLNGPPGTGKTSIAKAVAKSLKRENRFISCAGVVDPYFFKGHRRTYVDSQPGVFIKELIKANTLNPVFILDEMDKISKNHSGADPYYSLLEILNPEENNNFTDHYMDISIDFSQVIFILTANQVMNMLEPLQNRLEIIDVQAYIQEEKLEIAKNFLIKQTLESNGIKQELILYDNETIKKIIQSWCYYESGVRELKRCFEKIARKYAIELLVKNPEAFEIKQQEETKTEEEEGEEELIKKENKNPIQTLQYNTGDLEVLDLRKDKNLELLQKYLGPPPFDASLENRSEKKFPAGKINILTVGGMIGHVLSVECCYDESEPEKKGILTSSGNLKNVLQESLKIAKINALNYLNEQEKQNLQQRNIHIHFMDGSAPKDGPSAGTAICTALISIAKGYEIPSNIAMTGELSLNGNVCKIGGVQQKLIAAKTLDIKDVILPYANLGDALELPSQLLQGMNLYFVKKYEEINKLIYDEKIQEWKVNNYQQVDEDIVILRDGRLIGQIGEQSAYFYRAYQSIQTKE